MRMLFGCLPLHGHAYPLLPLAAACRDAGHDVRFATGAAFVRRIQDLGYPTSPVGIGFDEATPIAAAAHPELAALPFAQRWRLGLVVFADVLARATRDDLAPVLAADRPDLVVHEEFDVGAGQAARAAGIPAVEHSLSRRLAPEILAEAERTHGYRADAYLDVCPPGLQLPGARTPGPCRPIRPVPFGDAGTDLPDWIRARRERPLAYVTFGTLVYGAVEALRAAAHGLAALDCDVLVTVGPDGDPAGLGDLPPSVRVERFVPHRPLLPHLDLIAHHGGSGTMFGGFTHGIPQLLLPQDADQFTNAEAIVDAGAGLALTPAEITPESVRAAALTLLKDQRYREAARRLRREIEAMPPPPAVVPALERIALRDDGAFG
jgi:UDP:flavonoid glycosyltransferase YjiC (YdhE family)